MADISTVYDQIVTSELTAQYLDALYITSRPVYAQWHLNELAGSFAYDSSGNGRTGSIIGTATAWTAGKLNNCLYFSPAGSYVQFDSSVADFERTDQFSYEFWYNMPSSQARYAISKHNSSAPLKGMLVYTFNRQIFFYLEASGSSNRIRVETTNQFALNAWHHVVITYNGSSLASGVNIYVDGTLQALTISSDNLSDSIKTTSVFQISGYAGNNSTLANCYIDEVVIYPFALSSTEVSQRWNGGAGTESVVTFSDSVAITEYTSFLFTAVGAIDVGDSITPTEYVVVGVVSGAVGYDDITVSDTGSVSLGLDVVPSETILITEVCSLLLSDLNLNVIETIAITEVKTLSLDFLDIGVSETIVISEVFLGSSVTSTNVYDDIIIIEDAVVYPDVLNVSVDELVLVTESNEILDLELDIDIVYDSVSISEYVDAGASIELPVEETITIDEQVELSLDNLFLEVEDTITASEDVVVDTVFIIEAIDSLAISESVYLETDIINVTTNDEITISEYTELLDLIVELVVYEDVLIAEQLFIALSILYIDVEDTVFIDEYYHYEYIVDLYVYDDVLINELIAENFYVWRALTKIRLDSIITEEVPV